MATATANTFAEALQHAEQTGDVEKLVGLFDEDAQCIVPEKHQKEEGHGAIRDFWKSYLASFEEVRSEFSRISEADGLGVLEWKADAKLPDGRRVNYSGVSLIDTDAGRVKRFATYYDTAVFVHAKSASV